MFKKIIASALATLMFLIVLPTKVLAEEKTDYQSNIKSVTIEEDGEKFLIAYNTLTNEITINGEKIYMEVDYSPKAESVSNYSLFSAGSPTINWSSGRTYNYKIPWKGGGNDISSCNRRFSWWCKCCCVGNNNSWNYDSRF